MCVCVQSSLHSAHTHTTQFFFLFSSLSIEYFVIALNKFSKPIDFQLYDVCMCVLCSLLNEIRTHTHTRTIDSTKEYFWLLFICICRESFSAVSVYFFFMAAFLLMLRKIESIYFSYVYTVHHTHYNLFVHLASVPIEWTNGRRSSEQDRKTIQINTLNAMPQHMTEIWL